MRIAPFLCLVLIAGIASAQSGRMVQDRWRGEQVQPRGDALLRDTMMALHNKARKAVKLAPLVWDDGLAQAAGRYAADLARKRRFEHSAADSRKGQGENLWMGTRGAFSLGEMAQSWIDEKSWFRNRPIPDVSTTGNWADVGHYTQIVWAGTNRFGCAIAGNADDEYLVCRYGPAGNVYGQLALPPPTRKP